MTSKDLFPPICTYLLLRDKIQFAFPRPIARFNRLFQPRVDYSSK